MLIDFKVNNYRSFKHEQIFSMETGTRLRKYNQDNTIKLNKQKLLKSALVFGANANGKTNLIKALMTFKNIVMVPTPDELANLLTDTFGHNKKNTEFEINFLKRKQKFQYTLVYNQKEVVQEQLLKNDEVVFSRARQHFSKVPQQLIPVIQNLRKNQLLLYFAQQNNVDEAQLAYKWFAEDLIEVKTNQIINHKFKALKNYKFKQRFLSFLQAADFNIVDIDLKERQEPYQVQDTTDYVMKTNYDLYCIHQSEKGQFEVFFKEESLGTQSFIVLSLYLLTNTNKVLLIDEFDRSFHLSLAKALLRVINNEKQNNQFVMTTHELTLMDCQLRQDQIWFADKNRFGETELFSIFDFDDIGLKRSDFEYKKRYLEGRYGATQLVNQGLLLEVLTDHE